jgi:hypothetical protein
MPGDLGSADLTEGGAATSPGGRHREWKPATFRNGKNQDKAPGRPRRLPPSRRRARAGGRTGGWCPAAWAPPSTCVPRRRHCMRHAPVHAAPTVGMYQSYSARWSVSASSHSRRLDFEFVAGECTSTPTCEFYARLLRNASYVSISDTSLFCSMLVQNKTSLKRCLTLGSSTPAQDEVSSLFFFF